jgi:hypothetical protein
MARSLVKCAATMRITRSLFRLAVLGLLVPASVLAGPLQDDFPDDRGS